MIRPKMRVLRHTDELAAEIEGRCTLTRTDVMAVLSALSNVLGEELLAGNRVQLDGIGTFGISVDGEVKRDKNGRPLLHEAHVRDVLFKPSVDLKSRMGAAQFTTQHVVARQSRADISDDEVRAALTALSEKASFFTLADFAATLGLTISTARRRLKALLASGTIENIGSRAKGFYRLCEA